MRWLLAGLIFFGIWGGSLSAEGKLYKCAGVWTERACDHAPDAELDKVTSRSTGSGTRYDPEYDAKVQFIRQIETRYAHRTDLPIQSLRASCLDSESQPSLDECKHLAQMVTGGASQSTLSALFRDGKVRRERSSTDILRGYREQKKNLYESYEKYLRSIPEVSAAERQHIKLSCSKDRVSVSECQRLFQKAMSKAQPSGLSR